MLKPLLYDSHNKNYVDPIYVQHEVVTHGRLHAELISGSDKNHVKPLSISSSKT